MNKTDKNILQIRKATAAQKKALNGICPYFTMFPLEYPLKVLRKHKNKNTVTLDPFCGRGTTLFAARQLNLEAWGIDTSPVAVAIAKAKLASTDLETPLTLASELISNNIPLNIPQTTFFKAAYHPDTLRDLCSLREALLALKNDTDASVILRAAALGCLHGPRAKHIENTGYFSNQMPRTYASKPDYAVRYWQKHNLVAPKIDILKVLRRKIERLITLEKQTENSITQVLTGNSQLACTYQSITSTPSVIITSPPYFGMRSYIQDQWLRNWFLGGTDYVDYDTGDQIAYGSKEIFANSLGQVWKNVSDIGSDDLHMFVRFGIIPSAKVDAKKLFMNSLESSGVKWKIVSVRNADSAHSGKRQANQMKASSTASVEYDFHVQRA